MASEAKIRVVIFKDAEKWVAQCLEYDISAQAHDLDSLKKRFFATVRAEAEHSAARGVSPFHGIGRAPRHFEDMWQKRTEFGRPTSEDDAGVPIEMALVA